MYIGVAKVGPPSPKLKMSTSLPCSMHQSVNCILYCDSLHTSSVLVHAHTLYFQRVCTLHPTTTYLTVSPIYSHSMVKYTATVRLWESFGFKNDIAFSFYVGPLSSIFIFTDFDMRY